MANTKNTIQNIPLTGPLCLNKLKTDVTQFEGYNEKNTTVFGGELTPLWDKKVELSGYDEAYHFYNSKGDLYTIKPDLSQLNWYGFKLFNKIGSQVNNNTFLVPFTTELDIPSGALWGGMFVIGGRQIAELYLGQNEKFYYRTIILHQNDGEQWEHWADKELHKAINDVPWTMLNTNFMHSSCSFAEVTGGLSYISENSRELFLCALCDNKYVDVLHVPITYLNEQWTTVHSATGVLPNNRENPIMSLAEDSTKYEIYFASGSTDGRIGVDESAPVFDKFTFTRSTGTLSAVESVTGYKPMSIRRKNETLCFNSPSWVTDNGGYTLDQLTTNKHTYSISPYTFRKCGYYNVTNVPAWCNTQEAGTTSKNTGWVWTGHDDKGFIPSYSGSYDGWIDNEVVFTCLDNNLVGISYSGVQLSEPLSYDNNYVTISRIINGYGTGLRTSINYASKNKFYCFIPLSPETIRMFDADSTYPYSLFKNLLIDNRYVLEITGFGVSLFDTETGSFVSGAGDIGIINTFVPSVAFVPTDLSIAYPTTGCIYGSGWNASFENSDIPFTSYLSNPFVMSYFPNVGDKSASGIFAGDFYASIGDSVQSAAYVYSSFGKVNPRLVGTTYPIDVNGNIILPYSLNSKIINGYSNNDMIKINNTAYPLMYYNNNQKIYSYQLLSSMENIEGIFSLQGQQYTFDDNNIYNVTFQNGIISSAQPVCYKKNLTFLGTLPTSAIFYSFLNKTFYQFTGDAIVSKMFEANDINEIYSVAHNPSTLSLWICTDQGIYVMSDTDMFKLDLFTEDKAFFQPNSIIIVEDDKENLQKKSHQISFYKLDDYQVQKPIKLATKYYGLGSELKANLDCWYIRLHDADHKNGKLKVKVNTITNTSFETEEKTFDINKNMYDVNNQVYIRYQPKYQTAVAMQLELESDIAIYQISLGVNATDAVSQQSKFNF